MLRRLASFQSINLLLAIASVGCGSANDSGLFGPASTLETGGSSNATADGGASSSLGGQGTTPSEPSEGGDDSAPVELTAGAPSGGAPTTHSGGSAGSAGQLAGGAPPVSVAGSAGNGGAPSAGGGGSAGCDHQAAEVCDGVDNDCNGSIDENACAMGCTGLVIAGRSYMVCKTSTEQNKAAALCEAQGMRLVWIDSQQQNTALLAAVVQLAASPGIAQTGIFIGASDAPQEAQWHWINGANFWSGDSSGAAVGNAYVNWAAHRPNGGPSENCAVMLVDTPDEGMPGQWNDSPCNEHHGALCQAP
jgi:Lectin C-type domain/Putative metal-binding motif